MIKIEASPDFLLRWLSRNILGLPCPCYLTYDTPKLGKAYRTTISEYSLRTK